MKKVVLPLLALVLAGSLLLAGCGKQANAPAPNNDTNSKVEQNNQSTENLGPKFSKTVTDLMKNGKYFMRFQAEINAGDHKMINDITMAQENESTIVITEGAMLGHEIKTKILMKNGTTYLISDENKTYSEFKAPPTDTNVSGKYPDNYKNLVFLGSGTGSINGKSLPYEEYELDKDTKATAKYYFDGEKFYALTVTSQDGSVMTMIIQEFSDTIPADLLEVPSGYTKLG